MSEKIRVILFPEADQWLAQGIEHDICAQGPTKEEAYERFCLTLALEAKEPGGVNRIAPAPDHFDVMWNHDASDSDCSSDEMPQIDCRIAA